MKIELRATALTGALLIFIAAMAGVAGAQSGDEAPPPRENGLQTNGGQVLIPITPVRAVDTRVGTPMNPGTGKLGTTQTIFNMLDTQNPVFAGLEPGFSVAMNVTALNCTSFVTDLRIWPAGATPPTVSTMNPRSGDTPRTNEVIMATGSGIGPAENKIVFVLGNPSGSECDILVDIVGLFDSHTHSDLSSDLSGVEYNNVLSEVPSGPTSTFQTVMTITVDAPAAGHVILDADVRVFSLDSSLTDFGCGIFELGNSDLIFTQTALGDGDSAYTVTPMAAFSVAAGPNAFELACVASSSTFADDAASFFGILMTATYSDTRL